MFTVDCGLSVPALAGGDVGDDLSDEIAAGFGAGEFQQQIAGEGKVVAAQHESLNIGDVQINHLVVLRVRRPAVECGPRLPGRAREHGAFVLAGQRFGRVAHLVQELAECRLDFGRGLSLVRLDEMGHSGLDLEGAESLLHGLVVDVGEEEGGFDLALLHVGDEGGGVVDAGVADAMPPDGVHFLRRVAHHAAR